ncbi:MAG: CpsB/CapC family capsule biosynthesis tyrosine phosphatase [Syntrophomonas sp.]
MIDIHAHILPGLDDGARNLEESLEMARLAVNDGIKYLFATPHVVKGLYENKKDDIIKAVHELQQKLDDEQISLTIIPGAEIRIADDLPSRLDRGELLTLDNKDKYLLIDLPIGVFPDYTSEVLFQIQLRGITPILAHPERNTIIAADSSILNKLVYRGVLVQITCGSLTGSFGSSVRRNAFRYMQEGMVHVLASDAHSSRGRTPCLTGAYQTLEKSFGTSFAYQLEHVNPGKLLKGEQITNNPISFGREKFRKRLGMFFKTGLI